MAFPTLLLPAVLLLVAEEVVLLLSELSVVEVPLETVSKSGTLVLSPSKTTDPVRLELFVVVLSVSVVLVLELVPESDPAFDPAVSEEFSPVLEPVEFSERLSSSLK